MFSQSTHIVVSGRSAGGVAAFHWTNYIKAKAVKAKVWSLIDSGIFLDYYNVKIGRHIYK